MYYAKMDTEGGQVEYRVAPIAGASALCREPDEYVEVEWLEGPLLGQRTGHLRRELRWTSGVTEGGW